MLPWYAEPLTFVVSSLTSLISSCLMLWWLHGVRPVHQRKLIRRQLWHLVVADIIFAASACVWGIFGLLATFSVVASNNLPTCVGVAWITGLGGFASMLVELHLAVSCVAATGRMYSVLHCLDRMLRFVWLASPVIAVLEIWQADLVIDKTAQVCARRHPDYVYVSVMGVSVSLIMLLNLVGLSMVHMKMGFAVQHRERARVQVLVCVWVVCSLPNLIRCVTMSADKRLTVGELVVKALLNLNGFANTLAYAIPNSYLWRKVRRKRGRVIHMRGDGEHDPRTLGTYNVGIGETDVSLIRTETSTRTSLSLNVSDNCGSDNGVPGDDGEDGRARAAGDEDLWDVFELTDEVAFRPPSRRFGAEASPPC